MGHPRRPSLGSGHWAAYMATGNPAVIASATLPELIDALRLAREDVVQLKREVGMLMATPAEQVAQEMPAAITNLLRAGQTVGLDPREMLLTALAALDSPRS